MLLFIIFDMIGLHTLALPWVISSQQLYVQFTHNITCFWVGRRTPQVNNTSTVACVLERRNAPMNSEYPIACVSEYLYLGYLACATIDIALWGEALCDGILRNEGDKGVHLHIVRIRRSSFSNKLLSLAMGLFVGFRFQHLWKRICFWVVELLSGVRNLQKKIGLCTPLSYHDDHDGGAPLIFLFCSSIRELKT